jgi:hypothetical protein
LLKVFSGILDEYAESGKTLPASVLDAGCGIGVIGICAAAALSASGKCSVRCQDRDELARLFTLHNAARSGIPDSVLAAYCEPLLCGGESWDLILSNIPAKTGKPVLEDFVRRSSGLLNPEGIAAVVAVNTLAGFFRQQIELCGSRLLAQHCGSGHSVFVYARGDGKNREEPVSGGPGFLLRHRFYARTAASCTVEKIEVNLETVHGASGFDGAGDAALVAAKLAAKIGFGENLGSGDSLLVHEPQQGFFPCWLRLYLQQNALTSGTDIVLSGRNVIALEAARHNVAACQAKEAGGENAASTVEAVPAADLRLGQDAILKANGGKPFHAIAAFPELLPQSSLAKGTDQLASLWDSIMPLLAEGGVFLAAFTSGDGERFDRKKPAGFTRLGSIKRNGFRALAFRFCMSKT